VITNLPEKKWVDYGYSGIELGAGAGANEFKFSLLNGILIGTTADANSRIGNKIRVRGIYLSIHVYGQADMGLHGANCRFEVIHNKEGNVALTTQAVVHSTTAVATTRNSLYLDKIKVLFDRIHTLSALSGTAGSSALVGPSGCFNVYIPINKDIHYQASATTAGVTSIGGVNIANVSLNVGNLLKDDLHLMFYADQATCCTFDFVAKVIFQDM